MITVHGFTITGNSVVSTKELKRIVAPYVGKTLGLAALQRVADRLTEEYRRRGYPIAKAYVPAQEIKDGVVEIAILEGKIGEIVIEGNKHYSDQFIRDTLSPILQAGAIKQTSLETALLLLNDYPNLNVRASLEPGKASGTTDIRVAVQDTRPVHVTTDYNNFGTPFISRNRFGMGIEAGNILIEGSLLKLNGIVGENPDRLAFELGSYIMPLNRQGTRLSLSGSSGRFDVGGQLGVLGINGKIKTYDISIAHPLIKSRFQNLQAEIGFASKDNRLFMLGRLTGDDHLRMVKVGLNYDRTDRTGRNFFSAYGFQGLGEVLGGMDNNEPLATRQGADDRFTKANVSAGRVQNLFDDVFLIVRGTGQVSTGPLAVIEQFLLGGPDSVRGYRLGERLGDEGYSVSAELRIPFLKYAQLALFVDNGTVRLRNPAAGEKKSYSLTGAGPGLRVTLPWYETMLRFDVGFPINPSHALSGSFGGGSSPTVYCQAAARF